MDAADISGVGMVKTTAARREALAVLDSVVDPEIPVLTIAELGILRDVVVEERSITVFVTPTYSGCPAMDLIESQIVDVLAAAGWDDVTVTKTFSPPWTTDDMSPAARGKLADIGIAPPRARAEAPPEDVTCPQCSGSDTATVSDFGSTACKALMVCRSCGEPFDLFKAI